MRAEVLRLDAELSTGSIGVVTPFKGQYVLLERLLRDAVSPDRDLLVGTVHAFQGKEREVIVVSPVAAPGIHDYTLRWLLRGVNLWNVAITRPRARLVVVGDRAFWSSRRGVLAVLVDRRANGDEVDLGRRLRQQLKRRDLLEQEAGRAVLVPAWMCLRQPDAVVARIAEGPGT